MKVAVVTWGTRGDVEPYLALAHGFGQAGHEVRLGGPRFKPFARAASEQDVPYVPLGPACDEAKLRALLHRLVPMRDPIEQTRVLFDEYAVPPLPQLYRECLELARWSDVLVSHFFQLAGRMAAETLGRRWVSGTLAHMGVPSRYAPPPRVPSLGPTINGLIWRLGALRGDAALGPGINRARQQLGLPALRNLVGDGFYGDLNLIGVSRQVAPPAPDWPPRHRVTGYWFLDRSGWSPPTDLEAFVSRAPKPAAIGFGSMSMADRAALARLVARTSALSGTRVVLQSAFGAIDPRALPPTVFLAGDVPHDWLFPRVAGVVHHGGAGTSAAVFRAGVPSVFVPHLADQYYWAESARKLGVTTDAMPRRSLTAERLAQAIRRAARNGPMRKRAAGLGAAIRAEDGVGTAVRLVEELVRDRSGRARGQASPGSRT